MGREVTRRWEILHAKKAWHEPTGACGCCGMKVFADREGDLNALYRSARESIHRDIYLLRSTDRGNTFNGQLLHEWDRACPMSSMDFAETEGRVFAAWETGGQMYWARVTGAEPPEDRAVLRPGEGKEGQDSEAREQQEGGVTACLDRRYRLAAPRFPRVASLRQRRPPTPRTGGFRACPYGALRLPSRIRRPADHFLLRKLRRRIAHRPLKLPASPATVMFVPTSRRHLCKARSGA